jgi:hypothetical protein
MNLLNFTEALIRRSSQFSISDWMLVFSCVILGTYALLLARR